jgi:glyoxylase-like metal-dependent hydrolase (beta-lactamase superfamily II)
VTIHRRTVFGGAAALLGAPLLPGMRPVAAQPAPAGSAAPGFHRFRIGGWTVTTVWDGFFARPLEGFFHNAPLPEIQAASRDAYLPTDRFVITFTVTFAQRGDTLAVFDAGNGVTPAAATNGKMIANMAAAGIDPARVTHVIHSHFHGDHINGLLNAEGGRAFPNAQVLVPTTEWAWWSDAGNATRSPEGQRGNFANKARRFAPYEGIADGSEQMMFVAAITHRPELMMARPDWQIVFDFDGDTASATRRRVLDMVATDRIRVTGYHFPFPASGHVARMGNGFRFVPADWSAAF